MSIKELENEYKKLEREKIESETKYNEAIKTLNKNFGISSLDDADKEIKLIEEELDKIKERINEKTISLEKLLEIRSD